HSVEVYDGEDLAGGIYGIAIGRMFYGESMFSGRSGGSKVALAALAHCLHRWGWPLLDAQVENPHLLSLGAISLPRGLFLARAGELAAQPGFAPGSWTARFGEMRAAQLAEPLPAPSPAASQRRPD
ncbi:leucyl/phenylalanyl-tRNA--protein transferase, partial [Lysobacter sp. 2RAB21]